MSHNISVCFYFVLNLIQEYVLGKKIPPGGAPSPFLRPRQLPTLPNGSAGYAEGSRYDRPIGPAAGAGYE